MPSRDSGLPVITRNTVGTSGNVFESPPAREGTFSALFQNSRKLASSCCGLRPDTARNLLVYERSEARAAEFVNTCSTLPKRGWSFRSYWWKLFSQWYAGLPEISDLGDASWKNSHSMEFQSWKVNFKTDVCSQCTGPKRLR